MRIGFGYDSHRFGEGSSIPVGGVQVPFDKGVKAHSDGDVLLHALCDAMLGAAALGDIGHHFPDTDPAFRSIASSELVDQIVSLLSQHNWRVVNVDATVMTEAPKLRPFIDAIRANIGEMLNIPSANVSVKATTNEKMGWIGRGEGLAAQVVVLLSSGVAE